MASKKLMPYRQRAESAQEKRRGEPRRRILEPTVPMPQYKGGRLRATDKAIPLPIIETVDDLR